ncbi:MAG TPA: F0F1 ATP synthase subunit epsilon [Tepidisphaeraceae bacterium]|nr:F0F1 ATP synthase subunit epsilon [Tepidisphaeraceae bacterium]
MAFHVVIVTPEQQVLDETVTQAILPAHDGEIGILTGRAPLLVKLGQGRLQLEITGGASGTGGGGRAASRLLYVEGGIAQMKDNRLTVLTQMAVPVEQIDLEAARAEYAEASAQRTLDERGFEDRQRRMQRARAMQELAGNRR